MPRLIDAHELWAQIYVLSVKHRWKDRTNIAFSKCLDAIQFFPIVDAEPVVRCKDCVHYWKNKPSEDVPVCLASPKDDAFCSEGERREDERQTD